MNLYNNFFEIKKSGYKKILKGHSHKQIKK